MTCIVGIEHKSKVYIGGDGMSSNGVSKHITRRSKVFTIDNRFLIGSCGCIRKAQIVEHYLNVKGQTSAENDREFMVISFVSELRRVIEKFGNSKAKEEADWGDTLLVGYKGKLYRIDSDYQCVDYLTKYDAIGSGGNFALGSIYATIKNTQLSPEEMLKVALKAASKHCATVASPYTIMSI